MLSRNQYSLIDRIMTMVLLYHSFRISTKESDRAKDNAFALSENLSFFLWPHDMLCMYWKYIGPPNLYLLANQKSPNKAFDFNYVLIHSISESPTTHLERNRRLPTPTLPRLPSSLLNGLEPVLSLWELIAPHDLPHLEVPPNKYRFTPSGGESCCSGLIASRSPQTTFPRRARNGDFARETCASILDSKHTRKPNGRMIPMRWNGTPRRWKSWSSSSKGPIQTIARSQRTVQFQSLSFRKSLPGVCQLMATVILVIFR